MDTNGLLGVIDGEIERLTRARKILSGSDGFRSGRGVLRSASGFRKKRHMSADARRRISEVQKKRWAARRKASTK
jgi:hypothetical protein